MIEKVCNLPKLNNRPVEQWKMAGIRADPTFVEDSYTLENHRCYLGGLLQIGFYRKKIEINEVMQ